MSNIKKNNAFNINIKDIVRLEDINIKNSFSDIESLKFLDDPDLFKMNVDLHCKYVPNNFLFLDGKLQFFSKKICGRCLEEFEHILSLDFTEDLKFSDSDTFINIESLINENYWLNVPYVYVCKDDCKGLCDICGTNLNKKQCSCDKEKKSYFFKDIFDKINKN